jgi:hypothetical protein
MYSKQTQFSGNTLLSWTFKRGIYTFYYAQRDSAYTERTWSETLLTLSVHGARCFLR